MRLPAAPAATRPKLQRRPLGPQHPLFNAPEAGQEHLDARRPSGCQPRHLDATNWRRQAPPLLPPPPDAAQQPQETAAAAPSGLAVAQLYRGSGAAGAGCAGAWAAAAAPAARVRQVPPALRPRLAAAAAAALAACASALAAAALLGASATPQRRQRQGPEAGHAAGQAHRGNAVVPCLPVEGWRDRRRCCSSQLHVRERPQAALLAAVRQAAPCWRYEAIQAAPTVMYGSGGPTDITFSHLSFT